MNNFQAWIDQADMPERRDGVWVDLETGIPYDPAFNYATGTPRAPRTTVSPKAQDARAVAKLFGGRALTGTARQKEWAEKIRAEKLAKMSQDQAEMACDPNGLLTEAKFWIENRSASGAEIGAFVQEQKALLQLAKSLRDAGKADKYAEVVKRYNALTARWGWA